MTSLQSFSKALTSLLLTFSTVLTYGQSPFFSAVKFDATLKTFETNVVFQDSRGFIWFATNQGLYRYDGMESVKYGSELGLPAAEITAMGEDNNGKLWLGHKSGEITIYENEKFHSFTPEEGLPAVAISDIFFDAAGVFWFGTLGEGLYYFKGIHRKRLYSLDSESGLNDNYAYSIAQCSKGMIYVGTDNGIAVIDTATNKVAKHISMKDGLPDNIVRHLHSLGSEIWIGMDEGGVSRFDIMKGSFTLHVPLAVGRINDFAIRSDNEVWVSSQRNGVVRISLLNNGKIMQKQFTQTHGLKSNRTKTVFSDREMNIWIAEPSNISKVAASPFEFLDNREGFEPGTLFSFLVDREQNYWAATDKGLFQFKQGTDGNLISKQFKPSQNLTKGAFVNLFEDSLGLIWAGTYGHGVFRIDPQTFQYQNLTMDNGLSDNNVMHVSGTGKTLWLSTLGGGATRYTLTDNTFQTINTGTGLGSNYVYSTFTDSRNRTWFAMDGAGLSFLENDSIKSFPGIDTLGIRTVYALTEDSTGDIWFISAEKGLGRITAKGIVFYTRNEGFNLFDIRGIVTDANGNILIAGAEGIQIFQPNIQAFETYTEESGIDDINPVLNAIFKGPDGKIWLSSGKGVLSYDAFIMEKLNVEPRLTINRKLLFFEPFINQSNSFNFKQNHFTFQFIGLWYQSPRKIQYRYKLENYDFDWNQPTQSRQATYSNLPDGKYRFVVEVSHKPGVWVSDNNATYSFKIRPPFYFTWWFILSSVLFAVSVAYLLIRARFARLKQEKIRLENEVRKRTATIMQQKEEIETQRDNLIEQNDFIAKQNKNITSSIQYASRIQTALYPPVELASELLGDHFVLNRPMEIVSGDFYWLMQRGTQVVLAVADCTGHGVPGAFMSVLGISLLNKIVITCESLQPELILDKLRDEVKISLRQTGKFDEAKDGMDMSLLVFNRATQELKFAGANNPALLIRDAKMTSLPFDHMPIGIHPKEKPFQGTSMTMKPGDLLYLSSDGYADQFGGAGNRKFMTKKFKELLMSISHLPMDDQRLKLDQTMNEWKGEKHQNDDILVLGIRF